MATNTRLGPYQILGQLGVGTFATVFRALDERAQRIVALKVLHPHLGQDEQAVARFRQEGQLLQTLRHPHIVPVLDTGVAEGRMYLVMELVEGMTLAEELRRHGPFDYQAMLRLIRPVCEALDYCHHQGVVHRDLKLTNILIDTRGRVSLTDFGVARLLSNDSIAATLHRSFLGTPAYAAPELWDGGEATPATDIYALACIVVELLTIEPLFPQETTLQLARAHERGADLSRAWPVESPTSVRDVLAVALNHNPQQRFSSAVMLWEHLSRVNHTMVSQQERSSVQKETLVPPLESLNLRTIVREAIFAFAILGFISLSLVLSISVPQQRTSSEAITNGLIIFVWAVSFIIVFNRREDIIFGLTAIFFPSDNPKIALRNSSTYVAAGEQFTITYIIANTTSRAFTDVRIAISLDGDLRFVEHDERENNILFHILKRGEIVRGSLLIEVEEYGLAASGTISANLYHRGRRSPLRSNIILVKPRGIIR